MHSLLVRTEVLNAEKSVCGNDSHKSESFEIKAFRYDLGTYENVDPTFTELLDRLCFVGLVLCGVAVQTGYSGTWKDVCSFFLDLLSAGTKVGQQASAFSACTGVYGAVAAVVTSHFSLGLVVAHTHIAVRTFLYFSAFLTLEGRGPSSA